MSKTKDFCNAVVHSMLPYLNEDQCNYLTAVLKKELYYYNLTKKSTSIVPYSYSDINDTYLRKFAIELRVQGMSEKTIYQYLRSTKNFLIPWKKTFNISQKMMLLITLLF